MVVPFWVSYLGSQTPKKELLWSLFALSCFYRLLWVLLWGFHGLLRFRTLFCLNPDPHLGVTNLPRVALQPVFANPDLR